MSPLPPDPYGPPVCPDINMMEQATVSLAFYRAGMAAHLETPHLVSFRIPHAYDWVRIAWQGHGETLVPFEQLIEWRRYVGLSRLTVNLNGH